MRKYKVNGPCESCGYNNYKMTPVFESIGFDGSDTGKYYCTTHYPDRMGFLAGEGRVRDQDAIDMETFSFSIETWSTKELRPADFAHPNPYLREFAIERYCRERDLHQVMENTKKEGPSL